MCLVKVVKHFLRYCLPEAQIILLGLLCLESGMLSVDQTWNLSQALQACLCKILLVRVKSLGKSTLFVLQFGLVCVQILGVEVTRVS